MEIWKPIENTNELYWVSNHGDIKSYSQNKHGKIMSRTKNSDGYYCKWLKKTTGYETVRVHQEVAKAFIYNPTPGLRTQVNHIDGDKQNNHHTNLEWCNNSENQIHALENKLRIPAQQKGSQHGGAKLNERDVMSIRKLYSDGELSQTAIANKYKVVPSLISQIVNRKVWTHI